MEGFSAGQASLLVTARLKCSAPISWHNAFLNFSFMRDMYLLESLAQRLQHSLEAPSHEWLHRLVLEGHPAAHNVGP